MATYAVTGANRGIGLEYVRQLSSNTSNTVLATVRSLSSSDQTALGDVAYSNSNVHVLECDVSSVSSIVGLATSVPTILGENRINYVLNNAAILQAPEQTSLSLTADALLAHVMTNVLGPAKVTETLLPFLAPGAIVVNITSSMGSCAMLSDGSINANITPYSISKTALNMLTVHQAKHLKAARKDVVMVCVDLGHIKTDMGGPAAAIEVQESASNVLSTIRGLKNEDSGKFLLYNGKELPW
ncbi:NADP-dependent dehydrogenase-like protein [Lineolata rhizophorae]|uniref:NADP-dependent dehydrogenase-like protein n=1 Tax=Lineolata rhizophorae TaxID=578093 RepID=A0A6A6NRB6_9PEZI|nr:NADP-dependent dehydrogenase-like protein [Lineolata rhizophorae]